jgi:hypothetical protein
MCVGTYVDILGRVMASLGILAVGIRTPWGYADQSVYIVTCRYGLHVCSYSERWCVVTDEAYTYT